MLRCAVPYGAAGLVDAVQALQQRNRLLQQDLDTLKLKYTGEVPCPAGWTRLSRRAMQPGMAGMPATCQAGLPAAKQTCLGAWRGPEGHFLPAAPALRIAPPVPTRSNRLSPTHPPTHPLPAELHHSHEVQGRSLLATQQELAAVAEQQGELQAARDRLDAELAGVQVRWRWLCAAGRCRLGLDACPAAPHIAHRLAGAVAQLLTLCPLVFHSCAG